MQKNPKISVIIVSYNSEGFIGKCISSVLKFLPVSPASPRGEPAGGPEGEVIVLDNNSNDGTVEILEKFGRKIKLIKSPENLGFAKGNNKAVEESQGGYLFFLNPDTEIKSKIFVKLLKFYKETPDAGVVGPKLEMGDGKIQPSVRKLPTILGAIREFILGMKNEYGQYVPNGDIPVEVGMVYGAAMLLSSEIFEKLNGFNEKYFLYYEDADLCKRVRDLGKKVYYYPGVSVKHLVGATKSILDMDQLNYQSSVKYHGFFNAMLLQLIFRFHRFFR